MFNYPYIENYSKSVNNVEIGSLNSINQPRVSKFQTHKSNNAVNNGTIKAHSNINIISGKYLKDGILDTGVVDINISSIENESYKVLDEKPEKNIIMNKTPQENKFKTYFSSFINYEDEVDISMTLNSLKLIKANCELNFETDFSYESSSLEFSTGLLYKQVKVKLEYCRILCSDINEKNRVFNKKEIILKPLLCLDFNQVTANIFVNKVKNEFKIMVLGSNMQFKFRAKSKSIMDSFLTYLNYYISISLGSKENLLGISLRDKFYKKYYMTENEFCNRAKTGDILLFKSFEFSGICQRVFTGHEYGIYI